MSNSNSAAVAKATLAKSAYFFCDKFGKQIAKDICICRQKMLEDIGDLKRLHNCLDCEQGKLILRGTFKHSPTGRKLMDYYDYPEGLKARRGESKKGKNP